MATVTKRGAGWQLRVTNRLLPKPFYHTFASEQEANNYGEQLESVLASGRVPQELLVEPAGANDQLVSRVITQYTELSPGVSDFDKEMAGLLLSDKPIIGLRLSGLTYRWAESYVAWMKSAEKNIAPGSIRKRIGALGRAIDWHIRQVTPDGAVPMVNSIRLLPRGYSSYTQANDELSRADVSRDRRLSPEEVKRIDAALAGEKRPDRERALSADEEFSLFYALIVDTGMRLSEAFKLRVDAVDLDKGIIRLSGSKGHRGKAKPRVVPLKRNLRDLLAPWCKDRVGLMFSYWNGDKEEERRTSSRLSRRFGTLFAYAEVADFTEHDLRHEAACRWFELRRPDGAWVFSEVEICKIMGWSNPVMALRYASLRGEDLASRLG